MNPLHELMSSSGFRPKKSLGQNFLTQPTMARKIAAWAEFPEGACVVEIGPGLGMLTDALLEKSRKVIAIEKDHQLVAHLKKKYAQNDRIELHHGDVLEIDLASLIGNEESPVFAVSNLPYSISTPIIERLLENRSTLWAMTLLLQEEVVNRICSATGEKDYGRLAVWVQTLCEVEKGFRVSKSCFAPKPEVESRLVRLRPRKEPLVPEKSVEAFLEAVGKWFQHRRKTIRNALRDSGLYSDEAVTHALTESGLDSGKRIQEFTIQEMFRLFKALATRDS